MFSHCPLKNGSVRGARMFEFVPGSFSSFHVACDAALRVVLVCCRSRRFPSVRETRSMCVESVQSEVVTFCLHVFKDGSVENEPNSFSTIRTWS